MAITWSMIVEPDFLSTSAVTKYTVPAATKVQIDHCTVFNSDASARTVTVHLVPASGTASDENAIVKSLSLDAGETVILPELNHKIGPGMTIQALASVANLVSITVSGSISA